MITYMDIENIKRLEKETRRKYIVIKKEFDGERKIEIYDIKQREYISNDIVHIEYRETQKKTIK